MVLEYQLFLNLVISMPIDVYVVLAVLLIFKTEVDSLKHDKLRPALLVLQANPVLRVIVSGMVRWTA